MSEGTRGTEVDVTLVQHLAAFATDATWANQPEDVRASTVQRVTDIVGLCLASRPLDTSDAAIGLAIDTGGIAQSTVIGAGVRLPAAQAAFVNGTLAHSLDYDDTHLPSILHPSASVVPAALAVGEAVDASGQDVLAAVAVGIEICIRLGMAGYDRVERNSLFFERGQHATSICGGIACAATASLLLGGDAKAVADAMGLAVSMSGGVIEANRTGGTVKRLHCGWAAHAGVMAAQLVARGFTGPPTVLEGRFGFYEAFLSGRFVAEEITDGLGTEWAVPGVFFKPYPANHFTHSGIDAARRLRAAGLRSDDVETAVLEVAPPTVRTIGAPIEDKRRPESGYHAKFSGPYTVAAALLGGGGLGLSLDDFTDAAATRPEAQALMDRISVEGDPDLLEIYPYQFPGRLTVRTKDGSTLIEEVLVNRGGPDDPLTDDELTTKFLDNAAVTLDDVTAKSLAHGLGSLATGASVGPVLAHTA